MSEIVSEPIKQEWSAGETAQYWLDFLARILPGGRLGCFFCLDEFEKARKISGQPLENFKITLNNVKQTITHDVVKELNVLSHKSVCTGMLDDARQQGEFYTYQLRLFEKHRQAGQLSLQALQTDLNELRQLSARNRQGIVQTLCARHASSMPPDLRDILVADPLFKYISPYKGNNTGEIKRAAYKEVVSATKTIRDRIEPFKKPYCGKLATIVLRS